MSKAEDEQQTRLDRAREIGLFRYMLIREAADPTLSRRQRGAMVRAIAASAHTDPFGRVVTLSRWTLDRWIAEWRRAGFDAAGAETSSGLVMATLITEMRSPMRSRAPGPQTRR
jgi:putative transposase